MSPLPADFMRHNREDPTWLAALPDQLERLARRWSLTLAPHYPHIAINYVAPATRPDGTRCVLKLSRHLAETRTEIAALRLWDGQGAELLASTESPTVLHGDLHHFNVLRAQRGDWLCIDPKGLVGDRCFDVCQFFRNPRAVLPEVNARRLDVFCAELGLDRARTKDWCLVHAVLDACWDFEDGNPWQRAVAYAQDTLSF
jgi:streptomycin 6-kinase